MMKVESQHLLPTFKAKILQMKRSIAMNQGFLHLLQASGWKLVGGLGHEEKEQPRPQEMYMDRVTATLLQITREWSQEGAKERAQSFSLILDSLQTLFPTEGRHKLRVLVPGSGLGRLPWEIARLGFSVEANELSWFMLLATRLILSRDSVDAFNIAPHATEAKNQPTSMIQNRILSVPDVNPSSLTLGPQGSPLITLSSGDWLQLYGAAEYGKWNCIVTCFFLDTASCVLEYVERISLLLSRGGVWINFGPLPYHYPGQESSKPSRKTLELTYLELTGALPQFGLELKEEKTKIECQYCQDPHSLKHRYFEAVFLVAIKI
jgi:carnosine N-methyltransferase